MMISVHIPDIRRLTEEEMSEIEEAFYQDAWRMQVESLGHGVWYSDGSLMEGQVEAGALNTREPEDPDVYSLGDRAPYGWEDERHTDDAESSREEEDDGGAQWQ